MRRILFAVAIQVHSLAIAQVKPIAEIKFSEPILHAYIDRPGDLYLQFENGVIRKYDRDGKYVLEQDFKQPVTLFDPRDGSRAFAYDQKHRQFGYFTFGSLALENLKEEFAIDPALVCSSGDKDIWIWDKSDNSIRRVNLSKSAVETEVLRSEHVANRPVISMREYQNFLFILDDSSRIFVFNRLGKRLKIITGSSINWFNFLGEELYYQEGHLLIFTDLFDGSTREDLTDPLTGFTLLTDERRYLVYKKHVVVLPLN